MRASFCDCDNLAARQAKTGRAEYFTQYAFDAITHYRIANFARSRYAQTLRFARLPGCEQNVMGAMMLFTAGIYGHKIPPFPDAPLRREALWPDPYAFGARRLRPFLRRLRIIARPPGVAMRVRKPCLRARRILLG